MVFFQIGSLLSAALQTSVFLSFGYFLLSAASYIFILDCEIFGIDLVNLSWPLAS